jgi:hypothetical protein
MENLMGTRTRTPAVGQMLRRLALAAIVPIVAAAALVALPGTANAAVGDFICTVSNNTTYSPGLRLVAAPQHVTFAVGYSNCISISQPSITGGTRSGAVDLTLSCLATPVSGPQTSTITWNTGQTSTFNGTGTAAVVAGQLVFTWIGTITAGTFVGSAFTEVISQNTINLLACVFPPGVVSQFGTGALTSV